MIYLITFTSNEYDSFLIAENLETARQIIKDALKDICCYDFCEISVIATDFYASVNPLDDAEPFEVCDFLWRDGKVICDFCKICLD